MRPGYAHGHNSRSLCRAGRPGFTLVEVLIALSVLAVTMTAVFTMFSSGLKLRTVTRDRMGFDRDARLLMSALDNDLANLVPAGPPPLVSADSIVLWRVANLNPGASRESSVAQMVSYQWSGSTYQDSLVVRLATPISVDPADSALVHQEFLKWARTTGDTEENEGTLIRDGDERKFGKSASLNDLSGSWMAYPRIRGIHFEIPEDITDITASDIQSRLLVRLRPENVTEVILGPSWMKEDVWKMDDGLGIEAVFWIPTGLDRPVRMIEEDQQEGAS